MCPPDGSTRRAVASRYCSEARGEKSVGGGGVIPVVDGVTLGLCLLVLI
jgi:hypothetical protein